MDIRNSVLKLIAANDGKWSWYQIERALSARNINSEGRLMSLILSLVSDELVVELSSSELPQPKYAITDKGRVVLTTAD